MFINRIERAEFNLDEIRRGTLIYAKHRSWKKRKSKHNLKLASDDETLAENKHLMKLNSN